jgi:hypothetical protein
MSIVSRSLFCLLTMALTLSVAFGQTAEQPAKDAVRTPRSPLLAPGGSGTPGKIAKWVTKFDLGDSVITESGGKIGIGTSSPNAKFEVAGSGSDYQVITATTPNILGTGVFGSATSLSGSGVGVKGQSLGSAGIGVKGSALNGEGGTGVLGEVFSSSGAGVKGVNHATSGLGYGVVGEHYSPSGIGVFGYNPNGSGYTAGYGGFITGRLYVNGYIQKLGGSFKIDHPLDPENKYLLHSFVESPDMKNIYDGVVSLDRYGTAVITLPDWFEVLNKDFRYQLTSIGGFAAVYIAEELNENRFKIAGGYPGMKVSWQLTGIRKDVFAEKYRLPIEELKPERERGFYLRPELFDKP